VVNGIQRRDCHIRAAIFHDRSVRIQRPRILKREKKKGWRQMRYRPLPIRGGTPGIKRLPGDMSAPRVTKLRHGKVGTRGAVLMAELVEVVVARDDVVDVDVGGLGRAAPGLECSRAHCQPVRHWQLWLASDHQICQTRDHALLQ